MRHTLVPVRGTIIAVSPNIVPRAASEISYTIRVENGIDPPFEVTGAVPNNTRWPDSIDTVPAEINSRCKGVINNGVLEWEIHEHPDTTTECPQ